MEKVMITDGKIPLGINEVTDKYWQDWEKDVDGVWWSDRFVDTEEGMIDKCGPVFFYKDGKRHIVSSPSQGKG